MLLIAIALGGCSLPGSVQPTVKIGLVAPFEGLYRTVGYDALYAAKLAVREANVRGGLGGYLVELVALDDSNLPGRALVAAEEMALDPDVVAVIGHFSDVTTEAALPVYGSYNLPLVIPASGADLGIAGGEVAFRLGPGDEDVARTLASYVCQGATRVALLEDGERREASYLRAFQEHCATGGVSLLSPGSQLAWDDYSVLIWPGEAVEGAVILSRLRSSGFKGAFAGGMELCSHHFKAFVGEKAGKVICVLAGPASPPHDFVTSYQSLAGTPPGPYAPLVYDAAQVIMAAIEEAASNGHVTREAVAEALKRCSLEGLTGPITFDEKGRRENPPMRVQTATW